MSMVREESSKGDGEIFTELPQFVIYSLNGDRDANSQPSQKDLSVERFSVSSFFDCLGPDSLYRRFVPYFGGCPAGRLYCNIQPNGDVTPCMFMPKYPIAGNLKDPSFEEIWASPTFQALRNRTLLKGICREDGQPRHGEYGEADCECRRLARGRSTAEGHIRPLRPYPLRGRHRQGERRDSPPPQHVGERSRRCAFRYRQRRRHVHGAVVLHRTSSYGPCLPIRFAGAGAARAGGAHREYPARHSGGSERRIQRIGRSGRSHPRIEQEQ